MFSEVGKGLRWWKLLDRHAENLLSKLNLVLVRVDVSEASEVPLLVWLKDVKRLNLF